MREGKHPRWRKLIFEVSVQSKVEICWGWGITTIVTKICKVNNAQIIGQISSNTFLFWHKKNMRPNAFKKHYKSTKTLLAGKIGETRIFLSTKGSNGLELPLEINRTTGQTVVHI